MLHTIAVPKAISVSGFMDLHKHTVQGSKKVELKPRNTVVRNPSSFSLQEITIAPNGF